MYDLICSMSTVGTAYDTKELKLFCHAQLTTTIDGLKHTHFEMSFIRIRYLHISLISEGTISLLFSFFSLSLSLSLPLSDKTIN